MTEQDSFSKKEIRIAVASDGSIMYEGAQRNLLECKKVLDLEVGGGYTGIYTCSFIELYPSGQDTL